MDQLHQDFRQLDSDVSKAEKISEDVRTVKDEIEPLIETFHNFPAELQPFDPKEIETSDEFI